MELAINVISTVILQMEQVYFHNAQYVQDHIEQIVPVACRIYFWLMAVTTVVSPALLDASAQSQEIAIAVA